MCDCASLVIYLLLHQATVVLGHFGVRIFDVRIFDNIRSVPIGFGNARFLIRPLVVEPMH